MHNSPYSYTLIGQAPRMFDHRFHRTCCSENRKEYQKRKAQEPITEQTWNIWWLRPYWCIPAMWKTPYTVYKARRPRNSPHNPPVTPANGSGSPTVSPAIVVGCCLLNLSRRHSELLRR
jgi:hypothetical protein